MRDVYWRYHAADATEIPAMPERELKFHIPATSRDSLLQAVAALSPTEHRLLARYYDTPERELAKARVALRLRNEDGQWVQTVKAPGADTLSRQEFNHPRPADSLDISALKGTPQYKTLSQLKDRLRPTYETEVARLAVRIQHQDGIIELAYDRGVLRSGGTELEIHELELELVSGGIPALFRLAEQWQQQYGLILELRSKAERGDTLAALLQNGDPPDLSALIRIRKAGNIRHDSSHDLNSAFQVCIGDCLQQIIRNTAGLAGIDSELATQAQRISLVHQLRVGVRRLRSCWKLFKPWIPADASPEAAELRRYFSLFGEGRDYDIVCHDITPRLIAAGMPPLAMPPTELDDPQRARNLAASAGLQTILLRLLEQSLTAPETDTRRPQEARKAKTGESAAATMVRRLNKWLNQVVQAGERFDILTPEERHDLRKKVKRLRYSFEFSQALLETLHPEEARTLLLGIQRALGELNDLYTAEAFYERLADQAQPPPAAWFAIGWIRAMQSTQIQRVGELFGALAKARPLKP
ncbi:CHAD domain-containing protein [Paracandidimonas soli]|uniref:CYTH and CHAD domain-containing protein n=1 Tax=Paracandidimonas soli TaxID=1917182 RepID=UPI0033429BC4